MKGLLLMLPFLLIMAWVGILIVIAGEGEIANAINSAGISGIAGALLISLLPGSLLLYLLQKW
jgi:hypothetical protein